MSFVNEDEVKEKLGEESYGALINAVEVKKWVYPNSSLDDQSQNLMLLGGSYQPGDHDGAGQGAWAQDP